MKIKSIQFGLSNEEVTNKTIVQFYESVAKHMGMEDSSIRFDCRQINIAANIQEEIYKTYENQNPNVFADNPTEARTQITMMLALSGPKVNKSFPNNVVEVQDGFLIGKQMDFCFRYVEEVAE